MAKTVEIKQKELQLFLELARPWLKTNERFDIRVDEHLFSCNASHNYAMLEIDDIAIGGLKWEILHILNGLMAINGLRPNSVEFKSPHYTILYEKEPNTMVQLTVEEVVNADNS